MTAEDIFQQFKYRVWDTQIVSTNYTRNSVTFNSGDIMIIIQAVLRIRIRIRIRIRRIRMFLGLLDPDPNPDPLVRGMDPDPDSSITMQK